MLDFSVDLREESFTTKEDIMEGLCRVFERVYFPAGWKFLIVAQGNVFGYRSDFSRFMDECAVPGTVENRAYPPLPVEEVKRILGV